jgi:deoxyribodipyrimidine photo-lyase
MRRWHRSTAPATCTTGCAWWRRVSSPRTSASTGGWGERYFARRLIDFDLAANNGGWQWAASSGCDAQPYFRIFNPVAQSRKFDPEGTFIRRYLPQLAQLSPTEIHAPWELQPQRQQAAGCRVGIDYPAPVVDHASARQRTLARYAVVKQRR